MSAYRTLVIGTAPSLKSQRAVELFALLGAQDILFTQMSDPSEYVAEPWDLVFFLNLDSKPARPLQQWVDLAKTKKIQGRFVVLSSKPFPAEWRESLDPEIEIGEEHNLNDSLAYLFEESSPVTATLHDFVAVAEGNDFSFQVEPSASSESVEFTETQHEPLAFDEPPSSDESFAVSEADAPSESPVAASDASDALAYDLGADLFEGADEPVAFEISNDVSHPDSDISSPLAGRETFNSDLDMDALFADVPGALETRVAELPEEESSSEPVSFGDEPAVGEVASLRGTADISTVQKYAALKEREAREKESTILVLKGQVAKLDTKLSRSEAERRRLTLANDEMKNQLSTLEENLSQKQFHIQKMESGHQEELRGLSLRLDNALFQASKSQNKLDEFRERVRNDFVKIRAQERELFNKLELQKRDAEALLASKDEQLLTQKREIDRLQYETETLRERLIEETEKAEERASRLSRAVQSLRLANDMLSGLNEEVLPAASESFGETKDDEDAA